MAQNTNNPVGSTDPRDLYDNAGNLDKFVNGDAPFYADRLNRQRLSLSGMQQDFQNAQAGRAEQFDADQSGREAEFQQFLTASGFSFVGDYAAGLTFTNRSQYTVRDGLSYRLSPTATLPYTTSGNWSIEQSNFALFPNEDVLRQDLADDQEPSSGAALVGYRGTDVATAISVAAPVNLQTVASIATAGLRAGARCSVNGTVFEIGTVAPRSSRYPIISAGVGLYAIPVENHTNNIIGTYVSKGGVVASADWALAQTRQQQGLEYDNRAGTVFLTTVVKPSTPEVGYLIEYATGGNGLAPLAKSLMTSGQDCTIVCYGDSVTWGHAGDKTPVGTQSTAPYPKLLQDGLRAQYGNSVSVINSGKSGWQTDEALAGFGTYVSAYNPDLTIIMFGINDCRGSTAGGAALTPTQYKTNLKQLIVNAKGIGSEVVVLSPTPLNDGNDTALLAFVTAASQAASEESVGYVDMHSIIAGLFTAGLETPASLIPDNVHFADAKNYRIADPVISSIFPTSGHIGAEIRRSGLLPMGHSDYFAVEYDPIDGKRYVWMGDESTGSLHRVEWKAGASSADIVQTISFTGIASGRVEVSLYGADCLLLSFTRVDTGAIVDHVCKLADLATGNFAPVWQQDVMPRLGAVVPIMPHQQRKHEGGLFAGLCGLYIGKRDYMFVSVASASGAVKGRGSYFEATAAATDEPEGLAWYWDDAHAKLLPVVSIWRPAGGVDLYSVAEPGAELGFSLGEGQLSRCRWDAAGTGTGQWGTTVDGLEADVPLGVKQLLIGGGSYSSGDYFNPVNLRITQTYDNAVRQGGGIYAYGLSNFLLFDGPNDLTYGLGVRWGGLSRVMMHITESGAFFGRASTNAERSSNTASLTSFGNSAYPVGIRARANTSSAAPCFLAEAGSLDYAVPYNESLQLGGYNASGPAIETWLNVSNTGVHAGSDNTRSCGFAAQRWSVLYAGTGAINTSDGREKTPVRVLTENELMAARLLAGEIGIYQWLASIQEKGEANARQHIGMTVQRAIEIMESCNLDPSAYGFICYDKWDEVEEIVKVTRLGRVYFPASDGNQEVTLYESVEEFMCSADSGAVWEFTHEEQFVSAPRVNAGDRYSFRLDQLNLFISAGILSESKILRDRQDELDNRLRVLESKG